MEYFLEPIEKILTKTFARSQGYRMIIAVLVAVALAFMLREPPYGEMAAFPATAYGKAIKWWLDHPFCPVPIDDFFPPATIHEGSNEGCASHCEKLAFRATLPLLNQVFGGGVWTLVVASNMAALLGLALVYQIVLSNTKDFVSACYATWSLAACYAGRHGFNDYIFGDAVAIASLLGAMLSRSSWLTGSLVLIAGFTDERALLCAPLVALYHLWTRSSPFEKTVDNSSLWKFSGACPTVGIAVCAYIIIRFLISFFGHVHVGASELATTSILRYNYYLAPPVNLIDAFGGLWLAPILFILCLIAFRGWRSAPFWIYLAFMSMVAAPAYLVWDLERSLSYLLPGIILSVCLLPLGTWEKRASLGIALLFSLLWFLPGSQISVFPEYVMIRLHHLISIL